VAVQANYFFAFEKLVQTDQVFIAEILTLCQAEANGAEFEA
jgi:hypothetical protein